MTTQPSIDFCAALVDALAAQGATHACVSPGSRNTPMLLALAEHPSINVTVHHDERSGAFFALGLAKATGRPILLSCTSGTAATEYLPAITEARMSHTPLIALTADRPPELQNRGAPQTIDQANLYGTAAKWFHDTGAPDSRLIATAGELGSLAVATALRAPAGPVHLNIPLRDPLVPSALMAGGAGRGQDHSQPIGPIARTAPSSADVDFLAGLVSGRPTAIVAGHSTSPGLRDAVALLAERLDAIVIADPQSDLRFAGTDDAALISHADLLLAAGFRGRSDPEVVLHIGAIHTSKPVNEWLASLDADVVHLHNRQWSDPLGVAVRVIEADPKMTVAAVAAAVGQAPGEWANAWRIADDAAARALDEGLHANSEPALARAFVERTPPGSMLIAGSSMPIRLIDSYSTRRHDRARVISNRGANGIDGTIATALGVAAAGLGPTYALLGDITALVDVGSLVTASQMNIPLTIVVINNDGGGIFEYLAQADPARIDPATYRRLIVAPHGRSLRTIAAAFDVAAREVVDAEALGEMVGHTPDGPQLVEVRTSRGAGPVDRRAAIAMVAAAVSSL